MVRPIVYIETTVVSYLTARPSASFLVAAHQQITAKWWKLVLPHCKPCVSPIVLDEASRGNPELAKRRLARIAGFPVLEVNEDIRQLATLYYKKIDIPKKAWADAYHLAIATWHGVDFLVSWNCTHIVSGRVRALLARLNAERAIETPVICTPGELMEV